MTIKWHNISTLTDDAKTKMYWAESIMFPHLDPQFSTMWTYLPETPYTFTRKWDSHFDEYVLSKIPDSAIQTSPNAFYDCYSIIAVFTHINNIKFYFTSEEEMMMAILKYPELFDNGVTNS